MTVKIKYDTSHDSRHWKIVEGVKARKELSLRKMADRRDIWDRLDERVLAYIPETQLEHYLRLKREDGGLPQYTTIHIPWSLAILLSMHAYLVQVFLARSPVFQYQGRHGEADLKVLKVEALMDYQMQVGGIMVPLFTWLYDVSKYGLGIVGHYWDEDYAVVSRIEEVQPTTFGIPYGQPKKQKVTERILSYEGNRVYNIRPHDWLPDPRVPITRFQTGEFCGRLVPVGWNEMRRQEAAGNYFNLEHVKRLYLQRMMKDREQGGVGAEVPDDDGASLDHLWSDKEEMGFIELTEMVVELSPKDWDLGQGSAPEKWVFTTALDDVVVGCRPLGCYHNRFPNDILVNDFNTHTLEPISMLEHGAPLEDTLTWLFNTHFWNVRKVMNDQVVVDPSRIELADLLDPLPGGIARLKPEAYGTPAKDAIFQLAVNDVTRQNIADSSMVVEMLQRLSGFSDMMLGNTQASSRRSATEVRTSTGFGAGRMKALAEYCSSMGFAPLSSALVQNTQQYYSVEKEFRVVGQADPAVGPFVQVSAQDIAGFYDYIPVDGSQPVDRYAQAALWKDLIATIAGVPQIIQQYDLGRIFAHVGRLTGLRSVEQFKVQISPDLALAQAAAAGNAVPVGGGNGEPNRPEIGASGGGSSGGGRAGAGVSRPRQVQGVGPSM